MAPGMDVLLVECLAGRTLSVTSVIKICQIVSEILATESTVLHLQNPINICGDTHGQFKDVVHVFSVCGSPGSQHYLFLGDYVDRGENSTSLILMLFLYKIIYPSRLHLLRGNHEDQIMTRDYGFYEECCRKYGSPFVWSTITAVFEYFPLAAIIDGRMLCVHGGFSPETPTIDSLAILPREQHIPEEGPVSDILWSDPSDQTNLIWERNSRGAGYLFGHSVVIDFHYRNQTEILCRSHQLAKEGFFYPFDDDSVLSIWAAPNYCDQKNKASVLMVSGFDMDFFVFEHGSYSTNNLDRLI